jgi:hypothetical protein
MKGQKLNCQFDFRPLKVKNHPDLLTFKCVPHTIGKLLMSVTTLLYNTPNQRFTQEVMGLQSFGSPNFGNFEIPKLGILEQNDI